MEFINPEEILKHLDLSPNMIAADFGCGSGGSTIPLAKKLYDGLIYAFDVQEGPLNASKARMAGEGIKNVKFIRADLEKKNGSKLADSSIDIVLIINVLFQAEDKKAILSEAKRILKQKGLLMVVDWIPNSGIEGIAEGRISSDELKKITAGLGFLFKKQFEAGKYHFGLILEKN